MQLSWKTLRKPAAAISCRRKIRFVHTNQSYAEAIIALNGLQSNFAIVDEIRRTGRSLNLAAIPEMLDWLQRAGYQQSDLQSLNIVHVAGTKGKGSTATFISSILNQYRQRGILRKIGLYTSPHLRFVRERIQLDGQLVSEAKFATEFFELWKRFEDAATRNAYAADGSSKPLYFRFLTVMAFHIFLKEQVDSAVIECGIGGEYDSTNVIPTPTVAAITHIGLDHVDMLGKTIPEIAWQKAGIMKPGAMAYTISQSAEALDMLQSRANEKGVSLQVVSDHPQLSSSKIKLGLEGTFQRSNASLAIEVAAAHLRKLGKGDIKTDPLPPEFIRGLETARLGGRCETRQEANVSWHLDGAHTAESIQVAVNWFSEFLFNDADSSSRPIQLGRPCILIFNQQTRDATMLLEELYRGLKTTLGISWNFSHVIFCSNKTFQERGYSADLISMNTNNEAVESLNVQRNLAGAWEALEASWEVKPESAAHVYILGSVEEAIKFARRIVDNADGSAIAGDGKTSHVLVTGSVHLVGGVLEVLETGL